MICWIKTRATKAFRTNNERAVDLFDRPRQFRWAPDSREKFSATLQTTETTRLISDFENSDLEQTVDINEAVSKFVVILETAAKQSLQ